MNVLLSLPLWLAVMMSSCSGDAGSHEVETTTDYYYDEATATPEYDYTATFDYYFVTGLYARNKAAVIGQTSPVLLLGLAVHHLWS